MLVAVRGRPEAEESDCTSSENHWTQRRANGRHQQLSISLIHIPPHTFPPTLPKHTPSLLPPTHAPSLPLPHSHLPSLPPPTHLPSHPPSPLPPSSCQTDLRFQAPDKPASLRYTVVLTSDSYIDLSFQQELKVRPQNDTTCIEILRWINFRECSLHSRK